MRAVRVRTRSPRRGGRSARTGTGWRDVRAASPWHYLPSGDRPRAGLADIDGGAVVARRISSVPGARCPLTGRLLPGVRTGRSLHALRATWPEPDRGVVVLVPVLPRGAAVTPRHNISLLARPAWLGPPSPAVRPCRGRVKDDFASIVTPVGLAVSSQGEYPVRQPFSHVSTRSRRKCAEGSP